ncbi:hypothetical protein MOF7_11715 [Methylobacterium oryzae]
MPALVIESAGPGVTLQDGGRHGYLRYGITAAGPMDPLMHAAANRAASSPLDATAVEISTGGVTVSAEDGAVGITLLAPGFRVALDGVPLPDTVALTLEPGQTLVVRAGDAGAWGYLAVAGRLDVAPVLGSAAAWVDTTFSGLRPLRSATCATSSPWGAS